MKIKILGLIAILLIGNIFASDIPLENVAEENPTANSNQATICTDNSCMPISKNSKIDVKTSGTETAHIGPLIFEEGKQKHGTGTGELQLKRNSPNDPLSVDFLSSNSKLEIVDIETGEKKDYSGFKKGDGNIGSTNIKFKEGESVEASGQVAEDKKLVLGKTEVDIPKDSLFSQRSEGEKNDVTITLNKDLKNPQLISVPKLKKKTSENEEEKIAYNGWFKFENPNKPGEMIEVNGKLNYDSVKERWYVPASAITKINGVQINAEEGDSFADFNNQIGKDVKGSIIKFNENTLLGDANGNKVSLTVKEQNKYFQNFDPQKNSYGIFVQDDSSFSVSLGKDNKPIAQIDGSGIIQDGKNVFYYKEGYKEVYKGTSSYIDGLKYESESFGGGVIWKNQGKNIFESKSGLSSQLVIAPQSGQMVSAPVGSSIDQLKKEGFIYDPKKDIEVKPIQEAVLPANQDRMETGGWRSIKSSPGIAVQGNPGNQPGRVSVTPQQKPSGESNQKSIVVQDMEDFQSSGLQLNKLAPGKKPEYVIFYFTDPINCGPCKNNKENGIIETAASRAKRGLFFEIDRNNIPQDKWDELVKRYQVKGIPTAFITGKGKNAQEVGIMSVDQLENSITSLLGE